MCVYACMYVRMCVCMHVPYIHICIQFLLSFCVSFNLFNLLFPLGQQGVVVFAQFHFPLVKLHLTLADSLYQMRPQSFMPTNVNPYQMYTYDVTIHTYTYIQAYTFARPLCHYGRKLANGQMLLCTVAYVYHVCVCMYLCAYLHMMHALQFNDSTGS